MSTLPVLRVKTLHSEYRIDQNAGTYQRTRAVDAASDLSYAGVFDGEPHPYETLYLEVGEPMLVFHADGRYVRSTPVVAYDEVA